jgi:hypothetical protein
MLMRRRYTPQECIMLATEMKAALVQEDRRIREQMAYNHQMQAQQAQQAHQAHLAQQQAHAAAQAARAAAAHAAKLQVRCVYHCLCAVRVCVRP